MTSKTLKSPDGTIADIATLFQDSSVCTISVHEDCAFSENKILPLGTITLFPRTTTLEDCQQAVRLGSFEWNTPEQAEAEKLLSSCLSIGQMKSEGKRKTAEEKVRRILDSMGSIPVRLGLTHPIFDPLAIEGMPFRRATTVISDTSGVIQGALTFVARHLHPAARIKVPAVVQMEVVNLADRFLRNRRASKPREVDMLLDHVNSQAAQRVLLGLELHSDVELERTYLLGDPLRGAFQREEDQELRELNLSVPIRSYADRLILEAARQHQSQVSIGHPVTLLTSDQGLARTAIVEGMAPLYFHAVKASAFFGRRFSGVGYHPFAGTSCITSITDVLWDLATAFGRATLHNEDKSRSIIVDAIGEDLAWAPYHSHDDLLWVEVAPGEAASSAGGETRPSGQEQSEGGQSVVDREPSSEGSQAAAARVSTARGAAKSALHKFSVGRLLRIIDRLETLQAMPPSAVMQALGVRRENSTRDYSRFLMTGNTIAIENGQWVALPEIIPVAAALRNGDADELRAALRIFPMYRSVETFLEECEAGKPADLSQFGRATSTCLTLAEITQLGVNIVDLGFFPTLTRPDDQAFADLGQSAYSCIEQEDGWIATGRWLERLVTEFGVHPCVARVRLQTASERGFIRSMTEGSTTETQFDRHALRVLAVMEGVPVVKTEYLYRGDFLIPGKSSSSLKIERAI